MASVLLAGLVMGAPTSAPVMSDAFAPIASQHLHNAHIVNAKVISGAQPEGDEAFAELKALGVRTIISVDGATPDVVRARRFGMRYVHLPIGYDNVEVEEGMSIARAIEEMPGRIYIHCHHGKHRSAAAVAVACVYNGMLAPQQADAVLRTFGTGVNYKGLWKSARDARPIKKDDLRAFEVEFVETARISDLAGRMVSIDQHWEHLRQIQAAGWKPPADHPDLDPAHEALQLQEHFRESARLEDTAERPAEFFKMLRGSENAADELRAALSQPRPDPLAADRAFAAAAKSCTSCHHAYRD